MEWAYNDLNVELRLKAELSDLGMDKQWYSNLGYDLKQLRCATVLMNYCFKIKGI